MTSVRPVQMAARAATTNSSGGSGGLCPVEHGTRREDIPHHVRPSAEIGDGEDRAGSGECRFGQDGGIHWPIAVPDKKSLRLGRDEEPDELLGHGARATAVDI